MQCLKNKVGELGGSHSGVDEDSSLLGYDAM
jgi:hypothetical protein